MKRAWVEAEVVLGSIVAPTCWRRGILVRPNAFAARPRGGEHAERGYPARPSGRELGGPVSPLSVGVLLTLLSVGCAQPQASASRDAEIVRGVVSGPEDDAVAVFGAPGDGVGFCSGTLVGANLVLTAKHCVRSEGSAPRYVCGGPSADVGARRSPSAMTILFGSDFSNEMLRRGVREIIDDGKNELCDSDIAILVLDEPVEGIEPRAIRSEVVSSSDPLTAVGWGVTEFGTVPTRRRKRTGVSVLPNTGVVGVSELRSSAAICFGDSGGPLFDAAGKVVAVASRIERDCASGNGIHVLARGAEDLIARVVGQHD